MPARHIPCGPFVNQSEEDACHKVLQFLNGRPDADQFVLFTNLAHSWSAQKQADEIDQLLVGPPGVRVTEVKHWERGYLTREKETAQQEARKLVEKVKKIASKVRKHYAHLPRLSGRFLLTAESKAFGGARPVVEDCAFFSMKELSALLDVGGTPVLSLPEVRAICTMLEPLARVALDGDLRRLGGITEMNLLTPRSERFHRVYNGKLASTRDKLIVHLYDLSAYHGPAGGNAEQIVTVARREFDALQRLQKSPWLPRVMDSFQSVPGYPGELYFFSVIDPLAPALVRRSGDAAWPLADRLKFARTAVKALLEMHQAGGTDGPSLHRNLGPETLLVRSTSEVVLTGLHLARIPEAATVATAASPAPADDGYAAPEVRLGGLAAATAPSDVYSLCQSLLTLVPEGAVGQAAALRGVLLRGAAPEPAQRPLLKVLDAELGALAEPPVPPPSVPPPEPPLPPPENWDEGLVVRFNNQHYRIVNHLGSGGFGMTFRVVQVDKDNREEFGTYVAKAAYPGTDARDLLRAYRLVRPLSDGPNLSIVFDIAAEEGGNSLLALLKWVEGESLDHLGGVVELYAEDLGEADAEAFVLGWIAEVCEGLAHLHDAGLVHGDVSPRNLIYKDERLTLTDYDLVRKVGEPLTSPGTPAYAPQQAAVGQPANPSHDVFALAASFFSVLLDREPFHHDGTAQPWKGLAWGDVPADRWGRLRPFLDQATAPDPGQRFAHAAEALQALRRLLPAAQGETGAAGPPSAAPPVPPREPQEVPWLTDLLRIYPGGRYGNAETRGLDSDFARKTYVETTLERRLREQIVARQARLVILCGNAGDGKTALLQHLIRALGLEPPPSSERVWRASLEGGPSLYVNFDGSAAWEDHSADELLDDLFAPFHQSPPDGGEVRLLAINDGRLQEWVERYEQKEKPTPLTSDLRRALDGEPAPPYLHFHNLNPRSLVGGSGPGNTVSAEFIDRLVDLLLGGGKAEETWEPCRRCTAEGFCPVTRTVRTLRQAGEGEPGRLLRDRLYTALRAVHQQGQYHITMRELRAALAYIFFGLDSCRDIQDRREDSGYANRAFAPGSPARQGELLAALTRLDPGLESHPRIDRQLLRDAGTSAGQPLPDDPIDRREEARRRLAAARRRAFFEWTDERILQVGLSTDALGLAGGRHLTEFLGAAQLDDAGRAALCRRLCRGIARLEDLPPAALSRIDGGVAVPLKLTPQTPVESVFWVEKPLDRFELRPEAFPNADGIETLHRAMILSYRYQSGGREQLRLHADLFTLLLDLADGYQLTDAGSDDTFANLAVFKRRLAQEDAETLYAWHPGKDGAVMRLSGVLEQGVRRLAASWQ